MLHELIGEGVWNQFFFAFLPIQSGGKSGFQLFVRTGGHLGRTAGFLLRTLSVAVKVKIPLSRLRSVHIFVFTISCQEEMETNSYEWR